MSSRTIGRALALGLLLGLGLFLFHRYAPPSTVLPGIASGNGRLEATEVDVATKVAGRLASVTVREGDDVAAGQVLAELDAEDLKAQLRAAEAQVRQARAAVAEGRSAQASAASQERLAQAMLERTTALVKKGFVTSDKLDRDRSGLQTAEAATAVAQSRIHEADEAVAAAVARVEALRVALNDATLRAPVAGRVLYRLVQPGEVLAAGGKAVTLLDLADVYLSIYLPTAEAGQVALGSPARIVLDALPDRTIPARVAFVAPRAQFTPKEVETRNEREKLMFRVKLQVEPAWLASHGALAKPGMPGLGYVQTDPAASWPPALTPR